MPPTRVKWYELLNFGLVPLAAGVSAQSAVWLNRTRYGEMVCTRFGVRQWSGRRGAECGNSRLVCKFDIIRRRREEDLVCCADVGFGITGGSGGVAELDAVSLSGAGGEAAQGGRRRLVSVFQILVFLWHQYLQVVWAVIFVAGFTEEEQLLVVFPFGCVEFVRCPASLDHLVFTVENCPKVLEFALYVFNCKTATKESLSRSSWINTHISYCFSFISGIVKQNGSNPHI